MYIGKFCRSRGQHKKVVYKPRASQNGFKSEISTLRDPGSPSENGNGTYTICWGGDYTPQSSFDKVIGHIYIEKYRCSRFVHTYSLGDFFYIPVCLESCGRFVTNMKSMANHLRKSYCWWFINPKANHAGMSKHLANSGINELSTIIGVGFLPSTIVNCIGVLLFTGCPGLIVCGKTWRVHEHTPWFWKTRSHWNASGEPTNVSFDMAGKLKVYKVLCKEQDPYSICTYIHEMNWHYMTKFVMFIKVQIYAQQCILAYVSIYTFIYT